MSKRFAEENARRLVEHLVASREDVEARLAMPSLSLNNGCLDPDHCPQHPGLTPDGRPMLSVVTKVSASRLHRLAKELSLV